MTADIVNLRQMRKAKARAAREQQAAENRTRFGRTKAVRKAEEAQAEAASLQHEGHRLDAGDDRDGDDGTS
jgi:hypothetical protein